MTRELEEAIRHIKTRADAWAVKEVEKALSQEPCDAISRETVLGLMQMKMGAKELYIAVHDLPSVTQKSGSCSICEYDKNGYCYSDDSCNYQFGDSAEYCGIHEEQKSGKWIRSIIYENTYNCSKCGSAGYDTFKYCPNCGAKMESEGKE